MSTPLMEKDKLHGWLQECKKCGHISRYDQYSNVCEKCGSKDPEIYFRCPVCNSKTAYGNERCSGCGKEISFLISAPYLKQEIEEEKKQKKKKIFYTALIGVSFTVLTLIAGISIPLSLLIGAGAALFTWFIN